VDALPKAISSQEGPFHWVQDLRGPMSVPMLEKAVEGREYVAIGLLSLSALALEISLTRLLSLVEWYHFAFMVVSIALFGYGAAGSFLSLFPSLRADRRVAPYAAVMFAIFGLLSLVFVASFRFDPIRANSKPLHLVVILFQYVGLGLPFLFVGTCLSSLITRHPKEANRIYFADLVGAGSGCVVAIALFCVGGPPVAIVVSAFAALVSCGLLSVSAGLRRLTYVSAAGIGILLLASAPIASYEPRISQYKALSAVLMYPDARRVWSGWNSVSRVDAVESAIIRHAPGLAFSRRERIPRQIGITVDGDNLEPITRFDGNLSTLDFVEALPSSVAYQIGARRQVLILDAGAGFDVLVAMRNGASRITAVERNPSIVNLVRGVFGDFSGDIYSEPDVNVHISDARSYLAGSREIFDLVEISLKQSPLAASTGFYSLSENYLFTVQSFQEIFRHLSKEGVLVVTRWLSPPPRQSARIFSTMMRSLQMEGVKDPSLHLAAFRTYLTVTVMMKRDPFQPSEIEALRTIAERRGYDLVYLPDMVEEEANRFNVFQSPDYYAAFSVLAKPEESSLFLRQYAFDLSPPTDEKPFFFDVMKWSKIGVLRKALGPAWNPYLEGGFLVVAVMIQAAIASALFILLPVLLSSRSRQDVPKKGRWVAYFLFLGGGYMIVEVAFLQKFILFLGQPAYAMAAVLFSMLVFSGLGSLWSGRFSPRRRLVGGAVLGISILLGLQYIFLDSLLYSFLGSDLWIKFVLCVGFIAPPALLMGIPFPTGIRILGQDRQSVIPLVYSANGCSSVVGSAGAIFLAEWTGFSPLLLVGAGIYVVSWIFLKGSR